MTDIFISPSEDLYENYYAKVERNANILCYSYIVTDCMMTDLHRLLRASSKPLECQFIQFFTYQMLVCPPEMVTRHAANLIETAWIEIHSFGRSHSPRPQAKQHFDRRQLRLEDL